MHITCELCFEVWTGDPAAGWVATRPPDQVDPVAAPAVGMGPPGMLLDLRSPPSPRDTRPFTFHATRPSPRATCPSALHALRPALHALRPALHALRLALHALCLALHVLRLTLLDLCLALHALSLALCPFTSRSALSPSTLHTLRLAPHALRLALRALPRYTLRASRCSTTLTFIVEGC